MKDEFSKTNPKNCCILLKKLKYLNTNILRKKIYITKGN